MCPGKRKLCGEADLVKNLKHKPKRLLVFELLSMAILVSFVSLSVRLAVLQSVYKLCLVGKGDYLGWYLGYRSHFCADSSRLWASILYISLTTYLPIIEYSLAGFWPSHTRFFLQYHMPMYTPPAKTERKLWFKSSFACTKHLQFHDILSNIIVK